MANEEINEKVWTGGIGFDKKKFLDLFLDQPWHQKCVVIPKYMPPFPQKDTRPTVVVQYAGFNTEHPPYLRYSHGPKQEYFWDIYGDDMLSVELALYALSQAPSPRDVSPITFKFKMPVRNDPENPA